MPENLIVRNEFIFSQAPFHQCHASTLEETPKGLIASWFGGSHEKSQDVEIWLSQKINNNWSNPISIANGVKGDKRYPTWNPVLFQIPQGPLMLFYKVGPNVRDWHGVLKLSYNDGISWTKGHRLPNNIFGPKKNKPILMSDGRLICPSSTEKNGWQVHFEITKDFGKTWKISRPINQTDEYSIIQPTLLKHGSNSLQMLARSKHNYIVECWSLDGGNTWGPLGFIDLPNPNSGIDAITLKSGIHILVYNHSQKTPTQWGGSRCPLNVAVSRNGREWNSILTLEGCGGHHSKQLELGSESDLHKSEINIYSYEYSYPAVIQTNDGLVHIVYSWKRRRIKHVVINPRYL